RLDRSGDSPLGRGHKLIRSRTRGPCTAYAGELKVNSQGRRRLSDGRVGLSPQPLQGIPVPDPTMNFNPRVEAMQPSATLAMTARAGQLRREGRPVIGLSAGEPDFVTPMPINEAAMQAIREGFTHYTDNAGMLE